MLGQPEETLGAGPAGTTGLPGTTSLTPGGNWGVLQAAVSSDRWWRSPGG